ncbi:MAG: hypothetical protein U0163_05330 [Gemmatimonadaceae bacterium]
MRDALRVFVDRAALGPTFASAFALLVLGLSILRPGSLMPFTSASQSSIDSVASVQLGRARFLRVQVALLPMLDSILPPVQLPST